MAKKVLLLSSHFVQYSPPVFRILEKDPRIDLTVAYCSLQGAHSGFDPGFGVDVAWDTPLTEGYRWIEVPNRSWRPGLGRFFGLMNPGLWKLVRDGHFDAVVITGYFYASAWIAIAAALRTSTPIIFITDAHGPQSWPAKSKSRIWLKRMAVRLIFSLGDALVALSSGGIEYLKSLGFSSDRIFLAPYSVDNDWWIRQASVADRDSVRREWNIPLDAVAVLFCAKLQAWKGPMDLLEAFARSGVPNSYLVFAGEGQLRNDLERRAEDLHIAERVRFIGFKNQSQLPGVYRASDVLVLPSRFEPFGLVVNEAMLSGLPVIVSDQVGARFDLVRPGENGYVYPAGDINALASILREFSPDLETGACMGVSARRRMETWSAREYAEGIVQAVYSVEKRKPTLTPTGMY